MELKKRVGLKIRETRLKLGLTQEKLAEKANIEVSFLSMVENGYRNFNLETIEKITNNLELDILNEVVPDLSEERILKIEKINFISNSLQELEDEIINSFYTLIKKYKKQDIKNQK
ncbi:MAG: helix-turn-helix transcriptional regulator [Spirochaetes bacterium]|nr:helix-turn-helix transcriptional regulator [Spirochaetota bacterium]